MKLNKTVIAQLLAIQTSGRATADVGKPLLDMNLIEINKDDLDASGAVAARLTQLAIDSLPKSKVAVVAGAASSFEIITNAVPPESKKGRGREAGPAKYPFDDLPTGGSFFVGVSAKLPDPLKALGSAVSNATNKHRVDTGTKETVTRTKRGSDHKAVVENGQKVKEQVEVPVYTYPRKFVIRGVKKDQKCGEWVAPSDGVLISRTI